MIPEYQYRVYDESLTTPYFKKWVVAPLFRFIPQSVPANLITIFSNLLMYVALWMALTECPARDLRFILIFFLVLGYTIGDHLDGMQAKHTGTCSALGELCDHYLDIFNNGILLIIVCLSFGINNEILVAFFLVSGYLTHAAVFYEQFSTKWLYFEKFGSLESVFVLSFCLLVSSFEPVYKWAIQPLYMGLTIAEVLFVISSSGAYITVFKTIRRAHIVNPGFYTFCVFLIVIGSFGIKFLSPVSLFYVITFYSGLYIGNLQRGHLADGRERFPDIITPLFIVSAFVWEFLQQPVFLWILYLYLACHTLWIASNSFYILRKFWIWHNPPQTNTFKN